MIAEIDAPAVLRLLLLLVIVNVLLKSSETIKLWMWEGQKVTSFQRRCMERV